MDHNKTVALICQSALTKSESSAMMIINLSFEFISVVFLIITLYVYWTIPDMRETQVNNNIFCIHVCYFDELLNNNNNYYKKVGTLWYVVIPHKHIHIYT